MSTYTRRTFLKRAAVGAAVLAYPSSKVLGAIDRVRVGMIGVGDRANDLLNQVVKVPTSTWSPWLTSTAAVGISMRAISSIRWPLEKICMPRRQ